MVAPITMCEVDLGSSATPSCRNRAGYGVELPHPTPARRNKAINHDSESLSESPDSDSNFSSVTPSSITSARTCSTSSSASGDGDSSSWMRSSCRSGRGAQSSPAPRQADAVGSIGAGGAGNPVSVGLLGRGSSLEEETSPSTSATLSFRLPFSEDEASMAGLDPARGAGTVVTRAGGGASAVLDADLVTSTLASGRGAVFLSGLQTAEALRARIFELTEELSHMDRRRGSLEGELELERKRWA